MQNPVSGWLDHPRQSATAPRTGEKTKPGKCPKLLIFFERAYGLLQKEFPPRCRTTAAMRGRLTEVHEKGKKMKEKIMTREILLDRGAADDKNRTIPGTLSTETPVERFDGLLEVLDHSPGAVDLSRAPVPVLASHDTGKMPVGIAENIRLVGRQLKAVLRFGSSQLANEIWQDVKSGVIRHLSVGYTVKEKTRPDTKGVYRATKWQLFEVSIVGVPADPGAVIGRSYNNNSSKGKNTMKDYDFNDIPKMQKEIRENLSWLSDYKHLSEDERTGEKRQEFEHREAEVDRLEGEIRRMMQSDNDPPPATGRGVPLTAWGQPPENIDNRKGPATAKTYRSMFYGDEQRQLDDGGFSNSGEFLNPVAFNLFDPRLSRASMGTGDSTGYAVPETLAAQWLDSSLENEIVRPRAVVWPMESKTRKVPAWDNLDRSSGDNAGFEIQWLAEKGTGTRQTGEMKALELTAKKGAIFCQCSSELVADGMGFEQQLEQFLKKTMAYGLDRAYLFGTGSGQPQGCLSDVNPALIVVGKETGQTADTVVFENLAAMFARMAPACIGSAVWVASVTTIPQLLTLSIPIGTSGSAVKVLREEAGRFYILGKEVLFTEHAKTLGDQGDINLVDFTRYYIGMRKELSIDKSNVPGWLQDMVDFRIIVRVDGQSTWNEPLTPANGSTLSPFVTLEAR